MMFSTTYTLRSVDYKTASFNIDLKYTLAIDSDLADVSSYTGRGKFVENFPSLFIKV